MHDSAGQNAARLAVAAGKDAPMKVWHTRIRNAHTWHDLLQVVRDYIAGLEPQEWASVPAAARPDRIKGIDDIAYWHQRLEDEFLPVAGRSDVPDAFRHM